MEDILSYYNLNQYIDYLNIINIGNVYFYELHELHDNSCFKSFIEAIQYYNNDIINNKFDKTTFFKRINEIYSYTYTINGSDQNFHLIGKWDNDKYFHYCYYCSTYFYDVDANDVTIIVSKDYNQLLNNRDTPDKLIPIKVYKLK